MNLLRVYFLVFLTAALCLLSPGDGCAEPVSVRTAVEHQEVFVGETFLLQVQVEGSEAPAEPDLSALADFTVLPRGGQQNSSSSVTIVNGKMSRVSRHGYIFNYSLTPTREGSLVIPALNVVVDGKTYRSNPVTVLVRKPEESEDFKLQLRLAKPRAFVGEPVRLTVTWFIGKDVRDFQIQLPLLEDARFLVKDDPAAARPRNQENLVRVAIGNQEVIAEKGEGLLDGRKFLTVSFTKLLIAKEPGKLTLPQATVSCEALAGYRQGSRGQDPFAGFFNDDFFSRDFSGRSRQVYRTVVVPANQPTLEAVALPAKGRPPAFDGLVGKYSLAVSAAPLEVKVGDPITLTLEVAGPVVEEVTIKDLGPQLGANDFKVPLEMAPGVSAGGRKTFTQTIRARHAGVEAIPALTLAYFNPESGSYEVAESEAIQLRVTGARVVSAQDAEGGEQGAAKKEVQPAQSGINHNYEGEELLTSQVAADRVALAGSFWVLIIGGPPLLYLLIVGGHFFRRQGKQDPARRQARRALGVLVKELQALRRDQAKGQGERYEGLGRVLRTYLGSKLRRKADALTFADVAAGLKAQGVEQESLDGLEKILGHCEAYQYAGGMAGGEDFEGISKMAAKIAMEIDRRVP